MVVIAETEELADAPGVAETVDDAAEGHLMETVDDASDSSYSQAKSQVMVRKSHLKKMREWLLPYVIAVLLVVGIGGAVMLVSYGRTQQLNRQLQEQYGEYFTDE